MALEKDNFYPPHLFVEKDGSWVWVVERDNGINKVFNTEEEAQDYYIETLYMQGK